MFLRIIRKQNSKVIYVIERLIPNIQVFEYMYSNIFEYLNVHECSFIIQKAELLQMFVRALAKKYDQF